jgi:hypothetical protein
VLRQLDALEDQAASDDADAQLEAAIEARRADASVNVSDKGDETTIGEAVEATYRLPDSNPDDELEVMLANRRRARQEKSAGFCHQCGGPLQKSDQFCPKCGASLS